MRLFRFEAARKFGFALTLYLVAGSIASAQDGRAFDGAGVRAVASHIDQNALLKDTVMNIGANVKTPDDLIAFLDKIRELKPGYKVTINWVSPGPTDEAIRDLIVNHIDQDVEVNFIEFQASDLDAQREDQNRAIQSISDEEILRLTDGAIDPNELREVTISENEKNARHFERWSDASAEFANLARMRRLDGTASRKPSKALDLAGHALGIAKAGTLIGLWLFTGMASEETDLQTSAFAATVAASVSGAYLYWVFTRYGPEWLEYRRNFKISTIKVKLKWFSLLSWIQKFVATGNSFILRLPYGKDFARWFNSTTLIKFVAIDAVVRGSIGAYFRQLTHLNSGGATPSPISLDFVLEMANAHQDLLYSPAAEAKLQQLYEKGAISGTLRWVGVQTWGLCIFAIQMVTDFGVKDLFIGKTIKGAAQAIMIPTKILTIVAGNIIDKPLSARGRYYSNVVPPVEPDNLRITFISGEFQPEDRVTLEALNQLDGAVDANQGGQIDLEALSELVAATRVDPANITKTQRVARAIYSFYERGIISPIRKPLYRNCADSFVH